jgi:hypothetical protein
MAGLSLMIPEDTYLNAPGTATYTIPPWANYLDVVAVGGGGGGQGYGKVRGEGGHAGVWNSVTLTRGVDIPAATTSMTVNVAGGGAGAGGVGSPGAASTVTASGWTGLSAAGGAGGAAGNAAITGGSPGNVTVNEVVYYGGLAQTKADADGNSPGGGGAAAGGPLFPVGGDGAHGAVIIRAYQ